MTLLQPQELCVGAQALTNVIAQSIVGACRDEHEVTAPDQDDNSRLGKPPTSAGQQSVGRESQPSTATTRSLAVRAHLSRATREVVSPAVVGGRGYRPRGGLVRTSSQSRSPALFLPLGLNRWLALLANGEPAM